MNKILSQFGSRAIGRRILEVGHAFQIREEMESYNVFFDSEKWDIAPENTHAWK